MPVPVRMDFFPKLEYIVPHIEKHLYLTTFSCKALMNSQLHRFQLNAKNEFSNVNPSPPTIGRFTCPYREKSVCRSIALTDVASPLTQRLHCEELYNNKKDITNLTSTTSSNKQHINGDA